MGHDIDKSAGSGCAWIVVFAVVLMALAKCTQGDNDIEPLTEIEPEFVTASALNCRAADSPDAAVSETLPYRQRVDVLERRNGWSRIVATAPCWVSSDFLSQVQPPFPTPSPEIQRLVSPPRSTSSAPNRSCGAAPYCYEMSSCAEAQFYYRECGVGRLDGDNDGVPCESLC
jgi:hypothetical protein